MIITRKDSEFIYISIFEKWFKFYNSNELKFKYSIHKWFEDVF